LGKLLVDFCHDSISDLTLDTRTFNNSSSLECVCWQKLIGTDSSYSFWAWLGYRALTFGLGFKALGLSLGFAIILGTAAIFGRLVPLFLETGAQLARNKAQLTGFSLLIMLTGVAVCSVAGKWKDTISAPPRSTFEASPFASSLASFPGVAILVSFSAMRLPGERSVTKRNEPNVIVSPKRAQPENVLLG
jgi:hypothetical protein